MKVAILGGGGCFAINFANHLHSLGIPHFGIGRRQLRPGPFAAVVHPGYEYSVADLVEHPFIVEQTLDREKPDVIVNFAAQGEGAVSFGHFAPDFYRTNAMGLARVVYDLLGKSYLKQFIHISTSELYGSTSEPATESAPLCPTSPYAISKAAFDQHLNVMHRIHGFPATIIRPSNCYCPGQQLHRIIPKAIIAARSRQMLPLEGGGVARKSYLHADDLSAALGLLLGREDLSGRTFNVGPEAPRSIFELVQHIANVCDVPFDQFVEMAPDRVGQDACYWIDSSAIREATVWMPTVTLPIGLLSMVAWIDAFPELLQMPTTYQHMR